MVFKTLFSRLLCSRKESQAVSSELQELSQSSDTMDRFLIAGLGNIGSEYTGTRHNMGFMVLDEWAESAQIAFSTERYGNIACVCVKGRQFWLLKPSTYMNLSGNAVRYWLDKLNIPIEHLVVICDDLNLPFGTLRMKLQGSDGGHNGLSNIIETLSTAQFARVRMGIGNSFEKGRQIDYVLGKMSEEELSQIPAQSKKVIGGIKTFAMDSAQRAMNMVNTK